MTLEQSGEKVVEAKHVRLAQGVEPVIIKTSVGGVEKFEAEDFDKEGKPFTVAQSSDGQQVHNILNRLFSEKP